MRLKLKELKEFLDEKVELFNTLGFIEHDPVSVPHLFSKKQDIEISGFFSAMLAWGQRPTIIRKCTELMALMDNDPHAFIVHHQESDLKSLLNFKHRTFNSTDLLYFVESLRNLYTKFGSLESAFPVKSKDESIETALIQFHQQFFSLDHPARTKKHISTPERGSTCKRLVMYLRWMVRKDNRGVDFGIWNKIKPSQLVCPCDLHVDRVARKLGLIQRKQTDWLAALELTSNLKQLDPDDPVKYDFALFGLGVSQEI